MLWNDTGVGGVRGQGEGELQGQVSGGRPQRRKVWPWDSGHGHGMVGVVMGPWAWPWSSGGAESPAGFLVWGADLRRACC